MALKNISPQAVIALGFIVVIIVILGTTLPPPYNFRYQINYLTKTPTFVCSNHLYSFSADIRGACSGNGYVTRKLNPDGSDVPPKFICKDESKSWAVVRQGACSGHGGVDYEIGEDGEPIYDSIKIPGLPDLDKLAAPYLKK